MSSSTSQVNASLTNLRASAGTGASDASRKSWFQALAEAWGNTLDQQAAKITDLSNQIGPGNANGEDPAMLTMLTTESMRMQFLANSASTSLNSSGNALETTARKQ
jgi:hypothetical protein